MSSVCKGSMQLGTGCGDCDKCIEETLGSQYIGAPGSSLDEQVEETPPKIVSLEINLGKPEKLKTMSAYDLIQYLVSRSIYDSNMNVRYIQGEYSKILITKKG